MKNDHKQYRYYPVCKNSEFIGSLSEGSGWEHCKKCGELVKYYSKGMLDSYLKEIKNEF